eukprot:NODE_353_length_1642_cov_271.606175.p7 GENE.NODE_353_length_1642_cov_271.606175~~NODE_353_length_1642_cov_271.606175.p7  ORF type:complete len:54 (+),score=12.99 NODE_353_length_1642_cov_271.606175:746-907(+)
MWQMAKLTTLKPELAAQKVNDAWATDERKRSRANSSGGHPVVALTWSARGRVG